LQGTDLPAGYTATPYKADPSDKADQAALVACVGGKDTSTDKTADTNSATFTKGNLRISSSARVSTPAASDTLIEAVEDLQNETNQGLF